MQVDLGLNLGTRSPESRIIDRDQARRKEYRVEFCNIPKFSTRRITIGSIAFFSFVFIYLFLFLFTFVSWIQLLFSPCKWIGTSSWAICGLFPGPL